MSVVRVLSWVVTASFLVLAAVTALRWLRTRQRSDAFLALAIGLLGAVSLVGRVNDLTAYRHARLLAIVTALAFPASGYALLMFRDCLLALSRPARVIAAGAVLGSAALALSVGIPSGPRVSSSPLQFIALMAMVVVWSACVGEPAVRFWRSSGSVPAVQGARLRALAMGYAGIVLILFVAVLGGSGRHPALALAVQLTAVAMLPLLSAGFAPPRWLRRAWRAREEETLRQVTSQLLVSDDESDLAEGALEQAMRLVGAETGFIRDRDGRLLARRGISPDEAAAVEAAAEPGVVRLGGGRTAVVLPLAREEPYGTFAVVSGSFTPLFGQDEMTSLGRYVLTVATALQRSRLVAELKQAGAAQALLGAIVHSSDDAIVSKDRDGFITSWNLGAERLYGWTAEQAIGSPSDIIVPEERKAEQDGILRRVLDGVAVQQFETEGLRSDGSLLPVSLSVSPIREGHAIVGASVIAREISSRKEAERATYRALAREREARRQLQEADRLKDEFLATVSHELRSPLAAIIGFADVLVGSWTSMDDQKRLGVLQRIDRSASEMSRLIEQILDFSRLQANKVRIEPRTVRLREAVAGVASKLPNDHPVQISIPGDLSVRADPEGLDRVLGNLLSNAGKFSPLGAEISVSARPKGPNVEVGVRDRGIGIAGDDQDRIFERFYQAGWPVSGRRGSGLGLAIARRYVELCGGRIWVESVPDEGSVFFFTLPAAG